MQSDYLHTVYCMEPIYLRSILEFPNNICRLLRGVLIFILSLDLEHEFLHNIVCSVAANVFNVLHNLKFVQR